MSTLSWEAVLTDLETRVELAEQALDEGSELHSTLLQAWTPPQGLGPLPAHLRERAIGVIAMQAEVEQRINVAKDQLGREITNLKNGTRKISAYGETVVPKYFDNAV
jgi:hypothetical protein